MEHKRAMPGADPWEALPSRLVDLRDRLTPGDGMKAPAMTTEWEAWLDALPEEFEDVDQAMEVMEELADHDKLPAEIAESLREHLNELLDDLEALYARPGTDDQDGEHRCGALKRAERLGAGDDGKEGTDRMDTGLVDAVAEQVASRLYARMAQEPPIKSAGFAVPYVNTHAPRDDRRAHVKAFDQYLRLGDRRMDRGLFDHLSAATKAAMQEDTDSEGGYLVPDEFSEEIVRAMYEQSWLRVARSRHFTMHHKTLEIPRIAESSAAVLVAEEGTFDPQEPTVAAVTFTAYKATRLSKVSDELLGDSRFPVWQEILRPDFEQAFAEAENSYFTTGTGSSQPQGVVTGASAGVTAASATAITADEVLDLFYAVDHKYRRLPSCAWMMEDATAKVLRKLKNGQGDYLWGGDLSKGQEQTLVGKPVIINNAMASMTTGQKPLLFGAFQYFGIADRSGITIKRLEELYAATGQVGFRAYKRFDSRVLLNTALKYLTMA